MDRKRHYHRRGIISARRNISALDFQRIFDRVKNKILPDFFSKEISDNSVYESKKKFKKCYFKVVEKVLEENL